MKRLLLAWSLLVAMATTAWADVTIDATNFPDKNFREYLLEEFPKGVLTDDDIDGLYALEINNKGIADLTGIEHFFYLEELRCYSNCLSEEAMGRLIESLPTLEDGGGELVAISLVDDNEQNVITPAQIQAITAKGWTLKAEIFWDEIEYDGTLPEGVRMSSQNFPDSVFREMLFTDILEARDCVLTPEEIAEITELNADYQESDVIIIAGSRPVQRREENGSMSNKIRDLTGVEHFTAIEELSCVNQWLTALDLSKNTRLISVDCSNNRIGEEAMGRLIASLPTVTEGEFVVKDLNGEDEQNVISTTQVAAITARGWHVLAHKGSTLQDYAGERTPTVIAEEEAAEQAAKEEAEREAAEKAAAEAAAKLAADKAAFAEYQTAQATAAEAMAAEDDSEACQTLIAEVKAAIGALTYDEAKTLEENTAAVDVLIAQLTADLAAQRAADLAAKEEAEREAEEQAAGISTANKTAGTDAWYTTGGRRLTAKPVRKGIYIRRTAKQTGKQVVLGR